MTTEELVTKAYHNAYQGDANDYVKSVAFTKIGVDTVICNTEDPFYVYKCVFSYNSALFDEYRKLTATW